MDSKAISDFRPNLRFAPIVLCFVPVAFPAIASGYLEGMPVKKTFASHAACIAEMNRTYEGQRQEMSSKVTLPDGGTRLVGFETSTNGIKRVSRTVAQYSGQVWYANGTPRPEIGQMEINHSWQGVRQECRGRTLMSTSNSGYTLSSFEPLPG